MWANWKVAASLVAVASAGCSANARFDLSGYEEANGRQSQSTASVPVQPTQPTPQAPVYGYQGQGYGGYGYQPSRYTSAPETASLGWNANKPETGTSNTVHVVRDGDNLWKISKQYNVPVAHIYSANGLVNDRLTPGQHLVVPR
jgi:LysM repeat protein